MSLSLDDRQRAMLLEMGVHVWWPQAALPAPVLAVVPVVSVRPAVPARIRVPPSPLTPEPPKTAAPVTVPAVQADSLLTLDWPALARTVADCLACPLSQGRRAPVFGAADALHQADWLVVTEPPDEAEERAGMPLVGPVGVLLDNMLRAIGVSRHGGAAPDPVPPRTGAAYVTHAVKCRPALVRNPTPQELATCGQYLQREVALVQPKIILAMGRFAAQALLGGTVPDVARIPLGQLRGQVYRYQGIAVVVTYPPVYLLRNQQDKARAWADLCLARHASTHTSFTAPVF